VELSLALLADAGLVGLPNAGKSSLLAALTRARPKVAEYPFTTIEPVLGTIEADDRQVVVADIPGLIEGAAEGAGLGHTFLAHVERCAMLVHVVEPLPSEGSPEESYRAVRAELADYGAGLADLPELIVVSKADLVDDEEAGRIAAGLAEIAGERSLGSLTVSSATGAGLSDLSRRILSSVPEQVASHPVGLTDEGIIGFEAEHMVYRPAGEGGYSVEPEGDGVFRINGRGVEVLFERFDLGNEEALAYLEGRLKEMGVMAALGKAGFRSGDEIRVGDLEFELH
jgi:GTP-binding protein